MQSLGKWARSQSVMTEMIERVARAILRAELLNKLSDEDGTVTERVNEEWPLWVDTARAAIEAVRDLSEQPGPRYTAGEYSRRNVESMVDDALQR
jgi:hypothetical protein